MKLIEHAGLRPLREAAPAGRRGTAAELTGGQQPVGAGYLAASCDLRVLMDQPTHSIPSHNPASRRKDCWLSDPSGGACLRRGVGGAAVMIGILGQHGPQLPASPRSAFGPAALAERCPPTAPHGRWPAAPGPACSTSSSLGGKMRRTRPRPSYLGGGIAPSRTALATRVVPWRPR
jgi:hypothetical protein